MQEKKDDESEQYDSRPSSFAMDRMSADRISMAGASHGGITIEDIAFRALPGAQLEVQLTFSEPPPAETQSYSIEDPARIVLDFPNTGSALGQKHYPLSQAGATSACSGVRRSYANDRESG